MYYNKNNIDLAKNMRSNMTKEERIIWNLLRAKRFFGYKFKRQVLIGDYIADFVCDNPKLIIEIDGGQYNEHENIEADNIRTNYFNNCGYNVIRFWNSEVRENIDGVCEVIKFNLVNC